MPTNITQIEVNSIWLESSRTTATRRRIISLYISYKDDRQRLNARTPEFATETYGIPRDGAILQDRQVESLQQYAAVVTSSRSTSTISSTQRNKR